MTLLASLVPLLGYLAYWLLVGRLERMRPSLSSLMNVQRRRWVTNAARRETPLDAILSGNLMGAVSFFASTTVLLILALFAVFGQLGSVLGAVQALQPHVTSVDVELHLIAVLAMFILAFLAFTLSLRQFNHFCIMLGAMRHDAQPDDSEIATVAALNALAARSFNNGLRAYYFSIAALAWFVADWAAIAATVAIVGLLLYYEFFSPPRRLVDTLRKS